MTAAEFIDALETKQLLSESLSGKLRKKIDASSKPLTAKSLARFLIDKGHLSKQDVVEALAAGGEIESPPPEPSSAGEPSGIDLPMDQLQDLSSSAEWSLDEGGGTFADPAGEPDAPTETQSKKKRKKQKNKNEWDSPLLLIGGGALLLLLVLGPLIAWIMFAENADKILATARTDMQNGSYGNAIANYETFVEDYPGNAEYSKARVELAMARIRQVLETGNEEKAFDIAEKELRAVGGERDFNVAEENLSDLLPRIARGLADDAEASDDAQQTQQLAEKATKALGMANNTKYIPKSRRDNTELDEIRATLDRIDRRQESIADRDEAIKTIEQKVAAGESAAAFAAQEEVVAKHPSLINDSRLAKALEQISAAEQQNIRYVEEAIEASNTERESEVVATLAVANRRQPGDAPISGPLCVQLDGAAYGMDSATGEVLWRRYIGPALTPTDPLLVEGDVLLMEWRISEPGKPQQSLVRVDAGTGQLVWRLDLDDQLAPPTLAGDRVLLAGASGKLHSVDPKSGTRTGFVQFAQPLLATPTVDPRSGKIYLTGERSSLYTLDSGDYRCLGVSYTKHPRGSVVASPAVAIDKIAIVENNGAETSQVRLFSTNNEGAVDKLLAEQRLAGRVVTIPLVEGRRITFITDRGQVAVYEVSVGAEGDPLTLVAQRSERNTKPFLRYAAMLDGHVWLAENALTKFAISPTGNRLNAVGLNDDFNRSQFVGPLLVRDGVVIHTRARRRRAGYTVTASSVKDATPYWVTDIATPPAGNPLASTTPLALLEANANGQVFRFDPAAIRTRVQNMPLENPLARDNTVYDHAELLAGGAAVFTSDKANHALLYSPSAERPLSKVSLAAPLACRPAALDNGWIAPLSVGQVFWLDSANGQPIAAPFQPVLEAGTSIDWKPPAVYESQILITDGTAKLYLLEAEQGNALAPVVETDLSLTPLTTGFVVGGDLAVALAANGQLATYKLPNLEAGQSVNPGGKVLWGPHAAGEYVVMATAKSLSAIHGEETIAWQIPLEVGPLAGPPLVVDDSMIVASQDGTLLKIKLTDGSQSGRTQAGEPISAGPVLLNNRIIVSARDGSLLVVEAP